MHGSVLIILQKELAKSSVESLIRHVILNCSRRTMYNKTIIMASAVAAVLTVAVLTTVMANYAFADIIAGNGGVGGAGGAGGVGGNGGTNVNAHNNGAYVTQYANGGSADGGSGGSANGGNFGCILRCHTG
jgi:uncharacterized membrane protein YgcG